MLPNESMTEPIQFPLYGRLLYAQLPPIEQEGAVTGWVFKRGGVKSKAWKKRYAVFVPSIKMWTYYESDKHAGLDIKRKGHVKVVQAAKVNFVWAGWSHRKRST